MRCACSNASIAASVCQPHQDIAAPGEALGIVWINRHGALDLRLCLFVPLMKDMDAGENDAGAHFGVIEAQRLDRQFLGAAQVCGRRFGQPINTPM